MAIHHMWGLGQPTTTPPEGAGAQEPQHTPSTWTDIPAGVCFEPLFPFIGKGTVHVPPDYLDASKEWKSCEPIILKGGGWDFVTPIIRISITGLLVFWLLSGGSK